MHFEIFVTPHSSLFIGGYAEASGQSDGDTAADSAGVLLPGSAVKGALRESAVRLVRGAGKGEEHLRRLFGEEEKAEGRIRLTPLRSELVEGGRRVSARDLPEPSPRMHVSLDRRLKQAAPQRLFQNRVTAAVQGLRFRGLVTALEPLSTEELDFLRAVISITDQIGAGRGRGLGLVAVELGEPVEEKAEAPGPPPQAPALVLVLEALEPLQLAGVKDSSNYTVCKDYLDGSMLRGAFAARLPESTQENLMGGSSPVCFGDGRPGGLSSIPAPLTLNEPKGGGALYDEAAVLTAEVLTGKRRPRPDHLRRVEGTVFLQTEGWTRAQLKRRTITRAARDHATGKAAHRQLFSLEVIDPYLTAEGRDDAPLRLFAAVAGSPEQLSRIVEAARDGLYVGGDRNRGLGRLRLAGVQAEPALPPLEERHQRWAERLAGLGVPQPEATGIVLALGPLAMETRRLHRVLAAHGLALVHGVSRRQIHGGWNSRVSLPRGLGSHYVPGSTFIVRREDGTSALPALHQLETEGLGPGRPDGWGRLAACHPIHVDLAKEDQA
jgi:CRISPR/Cas system CSM-associated protein Csm3 (group 7 of RAMP superfamily)